MRVGGFGGTDGLAAYLAAQHIHVLVDATHPYAATIAAHAAEAAAQSERPDPRLAAAGLDGGRRRPMDRSRGCRRRSRRAGRRAAPRFPRYRPQEVGAFAAAPQHDYLIRSVDPVEPPLNVPHATYIVARGPFSEDDERALLKQHCIEIVVAKNSGGKATYGKIAAARALGIDVIMLRRPSLPKVPSVETVQDAVAWLDHALVSGAERGV